METVSPPPVHGLIFDLDDTLYLEREYVASGFQAVAHAVATSELQAQQYAQWMSDLMAKGHDGKTFNHFLDTHPELAGRYSVAQLVQLYREHPPTLTLSAEWRQALQGWRAQGLFLGLISDGELVGQQRKVEALQLTPLLDHLILTDQYGKDNWKPHPRAFQEMQTVSGLNGNQLVYVGDNVLKDFNGPNTLGWHTVRLRLAGQVRAALEPASAAHSAQHEVQSLNMLLTLLGRLNQGR